MASLVARATDIASSHRTPAAVTFEPGPEARCSLAGDARTLDYATGYLGAWWRHTAGEAPADARVTAVVDPDAARSLAEHLGAPRSVPFYQRAEASAVDEPSGRAVVAPDGTVVVHRRADCSAIVVLPRPDPSLVCRIVRDLVTSRFEARGWQLLHAAAVARQGIGVLLVGPKGSGKTTASLALARRGWAILSNDRTLVGRRNGTWRLVAWPTTCNLGLTLLHAFGWDERLRRVLAADPSQADSQASIVAAAVTRGSNEAVFVDGRERKWHHHPSQLVEWYGLSLVAEAPLGAVVAPSVDLSSTQTMSTGPLARPLGPEALDVEDRQRLFPDVLGLGRPDPAAATMPNPGHDVPGLSFVLGRDPDVAGGVLESYLSGLR